MKDAIAPRNIWIGHGCIQSEQAASFRIQGEKDKSLPALGANPAAGHPKIRHLHIEISKWDGAGAITGKRFRTAAAARMLLG